MKIKEIHIGRFGKLSDYKLTFDDGFSILYGENEEGKTTILSFIELMFYGKEQRSVKRIIPRDQYAPWEGAGMFGSIEFEQNDAVYRLQTTFGTTAGTDKIELTNMTTSADFPLPAGKEVGEVLFGLDLDAFRRSAFIKQMGRIEGSRSDDVQQKLIANMAQSGQEDLSTDEVLARLEKSHFDLVSKNKKGGRLVKETEKLDELKKEQDELNSLLKSQTQYIEKYDEYKKLSEEEKSVLSTLKGQAALANKGKLEDLYSVAKQCDELTQEISLHGMTTMQVSELSERQKNVLQKHSDTKVRFDEAGADSDEKAVAVSKQDLETAIKWDRLIADTTKANKLYTDEIVPLQKSITEHEYAFNVLSKEHGENVVTLEAVSKKLENIKTAQTDETAFRTQLDSLQNTLENKEELWEETEKRLQHEANASKDEQKSSINLPLLLVGIIVLIAGVVGYFINVLPLFYVGAPLGILLLILSFILKKKTPVEGNHETSIDLDTFHKQTRDEREKLETEIATLSKTVKTNGVDKVVLMDIQEDYTLQETKMQQKTTDLAVAKSSLKTLNAGLDKDIQTFSETAHLLYLSQSDSGTKNSDPALLYEQLKNLESTYRKKLADLLHEKGATSVDNLRELHGKSESIADKAKRASDLGEELKAAEMLFVQNFQEYAPQPDFETATAFSAELIKKLGTLKEFENDVRIRCASLSIENTTLAGIEEELAKLQNMESGSDTFDAQKIEELELRASELEGMNIADELTHYAGKINLPERNIEQVKNEIKEQGEKCQSMKTYYDAVSLAYELMKSADQTMRNTFGPALNEKTGSILARLTKGKYTKALVNKDYDVDVATGALHRSAMHLSSGTLDQTYLALRIAISQLISDDNDHLPLFLDDVLIQYDDKRASGAVAFLKEYAKSENAQIVLFSCHRRMVDFAKEHDVSTARVSDYYCD